MKDILKKYQKWVAPLLLLLLGFLLRVSNATSFLGLICWGIAGLLSAYNLLALLKKHRPKTAQVLKAILSAAVILGVIIVTVTGFVIAGALDGDPGAKCEYILVLGAKVNGTAPSRTLRERIDAAAAYMQEHPDVIAVVSGGQGPDEGISEAQCMFNGLTERGIDPSRIWLEDKATSTWENLNLSLDIIEAETGRRPEKIGLVSSEFHLYRAGLFARECGVEAAGIPARTQEFIHFFNYFLREIAGVWHYILLGE